MNEILSLETITYSFSNEFENLYFVVFQMESYLIKTTYIYIYMFLKMLAI